MNINILRYSLFGIAGGQEVDRNFFFKSIMSFGFNPIKFTLNTAMTLGF